MRVLHARPAVRNQQSTPKNNIEKLTTDFSFCILNHRRVSLPNSFIPCSLVFFFISHPSSTEISRFAIWNDCCEVPHRKVTPNSTIHCWVKSISIFLAVVGKALTYNPFLNVICMYSIMCMCLYLYQILWEGSIYLLQFCKGGSSHNLLWKGDWKKMLIAFIQSPTPRWHWTQGHGWTGSM